jgi:SAM-dependent methyltransferase
MVEIEYLSSPAKVSMADDWFDVATPDHFWLRWRFEILQKLMRQTPVIEGPILEIGCGHGIVLQQMSSLGYRIDGCDLNEFALKKVSGELHRVLVYNVFDQHPSLMGRYNTIILMDVIEHIDDDVMFLEKSIAHLMPGGHVVINVPALQSLYSKYDIVAGHVRRYSLGSLRSTMERSNIEPLAIRYWGWPLLPVALARKFVLRFLPEDKVIKTGFTPPGRGAVALLRILKAAEFSLPRLLPAGTSLMAIGRIR